MRRGKIRFWLFTVFVVLLFGGVLLHVRINPITEELAMAKIADVASDKINEVVDDQIQAGDIQYDDLVSLEKDDSGNITALTTNMREINRLKTGILSVLDQDINKIDGDEISIPMGSLSGFQMLSGRGPTIPVKIVAVSSSDANFRGEFSDAGINQTIHRIMMDVSLELIVMMPSGTVTEQVGTEVCIAETVLLGAVPEQYAYFNAGEKVE